MDEEAVAQVRRHFDVVAERLTAQIQQVAEGVLAVDERLGSVHRAIHSELGEIKSMIKLSFVELDRRVTGLESSLAALVARVEKLEAAVPMAE